MQDELTRDYSQRLGVLTRAQLNAALARFDLGEVVTAEPAPGGLFGQNVMLRATTGNYVLRGHPHTATQFEREAYFARLIHEQTSVPAAWPFHLEPSPEIFGWSFAIMPWLEGAQIGDPDVRASMTPDDRRGIARAMAHSLADLQALRREHHGVYDETAGAVTDAAEPFAPWFAAWTRYWLETCRKASNATTEADVAWVEETISAAMEPMAQPFAPAIVHTDYKQGNLVAARRDGEWRVCGVFDLAELYFGDGEYDLARAAADFWLEHRPLAREFVETYLSRKPPRPGAQERFRLYMLHDRMIIWEYGQRNKVWFREGMCLRDFAERFMTMDVW